MAITSVPLLVLLPQSSRSAGSGDLGLDHNMYSCIVVIEQAGSYLLAIDVIPGLFEY